VKVILVGAGGTTRELLRRLSTAWEVTVIDPDSDRLESARAIRDVVTVDGDGSSSLVLRRAGLDDADALVAASSDDEVNLEALRVAQDAGVLKIIGVAASPDRAADYRSVGADVVSVHSLAARQLETHLEPRRVASSTFAQGRAEAIEFQVAPDSPVRNKRLRQLHSETFVVAAVLRDGELIVPHGSTRLEQGDRVTVVGAAANFRDIVRTFTSGESRFPLNFGRRIGVTLDSAEEFETQVAEALSFARNSSADSVLVVHRDLAEERDPGTVEEIEELLAKLEAASDGVAIELLPAKGDLDDALVAAAGEMSVGVLVKQAPMSGSLLWRYRVASLLNTYTAADVPVLLSRGRHPYSNILVPARQTVAGEVAARAGIDLARVSGATLRGVAVVPPTFVAGAGAVEDAKQSAAWLAQEAAVQDVSVRRAIRQGNPVRVIEEMCSRCHAAVSLPSGQVSPAS
jgi:Trk K+ transport system NAD-binding subunit/nucleotide-binding universal stress UspA family protein